MKKPQSALRYWVVNISALVGTLLAAFVVLLLFMGLAPVLVQAAPSILGLFAIAFLAVAGLAVYLLPSIVASKRNHGNMAALLAFNILLGWTFLGWALALVWALWRPSRAVA